MFPLNSIDMDKFIFDESKQSLEQFITNIKKYVSPPCITTNDTVLERKRKEKDFDLNNSSISLEDKNGGLFSDSEEANIGDF